MDELLLLKAALLGIVEGLTEFIPVSSTGHLIIVQDLLDFTGKTENAFAIFIQLGAILAVIWLYRVKFFNLAMTLNTSTESRRLVVNLIIGTLPVVLAVTVVLAVGGTLLGVKVGRELIAHGRLR